MHIRPKTLRRLSILAFALLLVCGAIVLWLLRTVRHQRAEIAGMKAAALKAYQIKDYSAAASLFADYLRRNPDENPPDAELAYEYADARANTPLEGKQHIYQAISLFQRYLDLAPSDPHDASHKLLKLYAQVHYGNEARKLAAKLLAKDPRDVEALREQVMVLVGDRNLPDALAACEKVNAIDPGSLIWQHRELALMAEAKRPKEQIVAHAKDLLAKHTGDARFQALVGIAYELTQDAPDAAQAVEATAKLPPPPDADSIREILSFYDDAQRYDLSEALLTQAIHGSHDLGLQLLHFQRMFEREQFVALADELKSFDPKASGTPTTLLAYRAMALYELHQRSEATAIADALAARRDDVSHAWTEALRARYAPQPLEPAVQIKTYRDAIVHDAENPVLHYFLGDARAAMGETDEAIREWTRSARLSHTWAMPLYRISRMLSSTGQYPAALQAAALLNRRAPGSPATQIAYAIAEWGLISNSPQEVNGKRGDDVLKAVENIRTKLPAETDILPIYVSLLSRRGQRDKAIEVAKAALSATPPPAENVMGQLAAVSDRENLGLGDLILNRAEQARGVTPAVAYARALSLHNAGKRDEALQLVQSLRASHPNDAVWLLGEARFRQEVGDPDALKTWIAVGDANPKSVQVQYQVLASPLRFADRDFWKRTIDRVKALTGDDAQGWQVEQARWELTGQPTPQDLERIITSLQKITQAAPELADVHRLLATALLRSDKPGGLGRAGAELSAAHDLQPDDFSTTAEWVPVLLKQGQRDRAVALVDHVASSPGLTTERRLWAGQTYAQLGNNDAAIALLSASAAPQDNPAVETLLASLYTRVGRTNDAAAAYLKLAEDSHASPAAIANGAAFFAASGQSAQAERFVSRFQKMNLPPASVPLLRARLQEMEGRSDQAIATLSGAARSHLAVEGVWQELAGLYMRGGRLAEAEQIVAQGLKALPTSATLTTLHSEIASMRLLAPQDAAPLLEAVSRDPTQPAAEQTIHFLAAAGSRNDPPQQLLAGLQHLAEQYPDYLPLQEITAQHYIQAGQFKDAADLASRAGELEPNSPEPLKLLCRIEMIAGNYEAARAAAQRWRNASLANPIEADINIAITYLRQANRDADAALKQLQPYLAEGIPEPRRELALPVYCQALITSGKTDDAAARLEPLIAKSPKWAAVWLDLSGAEPTAQAAADWLNRLQKAHPPQATPEKVAFAAAWEHVGMRFAFMPAHDAAHDLLQPLITQPSVEPTAWWSWALASQALGNLPEADRGWQEYLKLSPNNPEAQNNYAFVLAMEGGADRLPKAEELAKKAIAAAPGTSTFYDTLARIESQLGRQGEAVKNFRTALAKDPNDVEAMIGLADMLQSQPSGRDEARSLLTRINTIIDNGAPLAPQIRQQLDRVKTALSSSL